MRPFIAMILVVVGVGCNDSTQIPTTPSSATVVSVPAPVFPLPNPASFQEKLMVCGEKDIILSDMPCTITGEVARNVNGLFKISVGAVYQFQLYAIHSARNNTCRIFGNVQADENLSKGIVVFNTFENVLFPSPSPLYLKGLLFKPMKTGSYSIYVQATDSCDVKPNAISPPYSVPVVVG